MFTTLEEHSHQLAFIQSNKINVFPCGNRRGEPKSDNTTFPFDPEARLNTEANNRKHSGLNGFKQSYLVSWNVTTGIATFVVEGYLFKLACGTPATFGSVLADIGTLAIDKEIYANIKLSDVTLYGEAVTTVLRDQLASADPSAYLDFYNAGDPDDANNYYFSGLSFSAAPIVSEANNSQHVTSVKILEKNTDNTWQICERFKLPKIDHGDTSDSVEIPGDLFVDGSITAKELIVKNPDGSTTNAVTLEVINNQLQFWTVPKPKTST